MKGSFGFKGLPRLKSNPGSVSPQLGDYDGKFFPVTVKGSCDDGADAREPPFPPWSREKKEKALRGPL
ncbi:MAG: hypothetical protein CM1200mP27_04640 [Chloroflexota bacterium]|nr:MAG: hypothetical protein CM1200mP27_04640 [Chloroflexota bacterium]